MARHHRCIYSDKWFNCFVICFLKNGYARAAAAFRRASFGDHCERRRDMGDRQYEAEMVQKINQIIALPALLENIKDVTTKQKKQIAAINAAREGWRKMILPNDAKKQSKHNTTGPFSYFQV